MSFVSYSMNPVQASNSMRREIERLLQDVVPVRTSTPYMPLANGYEDANGFSMEFEVPGFAAEQLDVTAQDGMLIVKGTMPAVTRTEGTRTLFTERTGKSFERRMRLPKTADVASIAATHANGVLTVKVAKLATVAPRKVTINASDVTPAQSSAPASN